MSEDRIARYEARKAAARTKIAQIDNSIASWEADLETAEAGYDNDLVRRACRELHNLRTQRAAAQREFDYASMDLCKLNGRRV